MCHNCQRSIFLRLHDSRQFMVAAGGMDHATVPVCRCYRLTWFVQTYCMLPWDSTSLSYILCKFTSTLRYYTNISLQWPSVCTGQADFENDYSLRTLQGLCRYIVGTQGRLWYQNSLPIEKLVIYWAIWGFIPFVLHISASLTNSIISKIWSFGFSKLNTTLWR